MVFRLGCLFGNIGFLSVWRRAVLKRVFVGLFAYKLKCDVGVRSSRIF